ncbi:MAG: hypothetical protein J6U93_02105 [Alistipes sp.]|nr:hypothetical protein [Alistipes sp.]
MKCSSNILTLLLAVLAISLSGVAKADVPTISARFSQDSIEVGDVVEYIIDIEKDRATEIGVPDFDGNLSAKEIQERAKAKLQMSTYEEYDEDIFELVEEYPLDTLKDEGRRLTLRKRYLLAVMETGNIPIRPTILYFDKNREHPDTLVADDTLVLRVANYMELDTTLFLKADPTGQQGFTVDNERAGSMLKDEGIHTQKNLPFIFAEIRDYAIYAVIALIILSLIVWYIVWYVRNKWQGRVREVKPAPKLPPHVIAIKALDELRNRKLWQNGKHKLYYSTLTEILRLYIEDRWAVGALEMTTDEIISALRDVDIKHDSRSNLVAILRTADMVKFAKALPDAEENEQLFTYAYYFVENTKSVEVEHNEDKRDITFETKIEE